MWGNLMVQIYSSEKWHPKEACKQESRPGYIHEKDHSPFSKNVIPTSYPTPGLSLHILYYTLNIHSQNYNPRVVFTAGPTN